MELSARQRRRRVLVTMGVIAAIAMIAVAGTFMLSPGTHLSDIAESESGPFTDRGGIVWGSEGILSPPEGEEYWAEESLNRLSDEGTLVVSVYSDYLCPYCAMFEIDNAELLDSMVEAGDAVMVYHRVAILDDYSDGTRYSTRAAAAALYVAEQDPDAFKDFNDALFEMLYLHGPTALTDEGLAQLAVHAGVSTAVASAIEAGEAPADRAAAFTEMASQDLRQLATPTILLNGQQLTDDWTQPGVFEEAIRQALTS